MLRGNLPLEVSVNLVTRSYRLTVTEMYNRLAVDGLGTRLGVSMTILDFIPIEGKLQKFTADKGSSLKDTHRLQGFVQRKKYRISNSTIILQFVCDHLHEVFRSFKDWKTYLKEVPQRVRSYNIFLALMIVFFTWVL